MVTWHHPAANDWFVARARSRDQRWLLFTLHLNSKPKARDLSATETQCGRVSCVSGARDARFLIVSHYPASSQSLDPPTLTHTLINTCDPLFQKLDMQNT